MRIADLPKRQRQVCELLLAGNSQTEVASIMGVTSGAVNGQVHMLKRRFGLSTTAELIKILGAAERELQPPQEEFSTDMPAYPTYRVTGPRKRTLFFRVDRGPARDDR